MWGALSDERTGLSFATTGARVTHCYMYYLGADSIENTSIALQWSSTLVAYCCRLYLVTGYLPIIGLRWKMFIEPLPSKGSIRHSIKDVGKIEESD
jgi:hypothetical protein